MNKTDSKNWFHVKFAFPHCEEISDKCVQGRRELQKSGGSECPICPQFSENSLFIAFLCDNFLDFPKSGGSADPSDPPVTSPLVVRNRRCSVSAIRCLQEDCWKLQILWEWKWFEIQANFNTFSSQDSEPYLDQTFSRKYLHPQHGYVTVFYVNRCWSRLKNVNRFQVVIICPYSLASNQDSTQGIEPSVQLFWLPFLQWY